MLNLRVMMLNRMVVGPRQIEVLDYINEYLLEHERGPTAREIESAFGWSEGANASQFHLKILLSTGLLTRIPGRHRDVTVTEAGIDALDNAKLADSIRRVDEGG